MFSASCEVGVGAVRLGQGRPVGSSSCRRPPPSRVVGRRTWPDSTSEQHVGTFVLDRLERADRAAELSRVPSRTRRPCRARLGTATISFADIAAAWSRVFANAGQTGARLTERVAATFASRASLLAGLVHRGDGVRVSPDAPASTVKKAMPSSPSSVEAGATTMGRRCARRSRTSWCRRACIAPEPLGHHLDAVGAHVPLAR